MERERLTKDERRKGYPTMPGLLYSQPGEPIQTITHIGGTRGFEIDAPVDALCDGVTGGAPSRRQSRRTSFSALKRRHACRSDAAHLQVVSENGWER